MRASGNSLRMACTVSRAADVGQPQVHQRDVRPVDAIERARLLAARRFRADDDVGLERHDAGQAHPDQIVIVDQHQFQLVRHDAPSAPLAGA